MEFPSSRLFSLHVPVPPKVFLSMVYKFEGSTDVQVALELTTGDASSCHVGGMLVLNGERLNNFLEVEKAQALGWTSVGGAVVGGTAVGRLLWAELLWAGPLWVGLLWATLLWMGLGSSHLGWNLWLVIITCT